MNTQHTKNPEEFFKEMRRVSLSPSAREDMHRTLEAYADFHPVHLGYVRTEEARRLVHRGVLMQIVRLPLLLANRKYMHIIAPAMVILALSGGTSYAAESAIPGTALYPIKVELNERIAGFFNISDAAKAEWQGELALRRINEAEWLAAVGSLDAETEAALRAKIATNIKSAVARTQALDESGNADTAADVRTNIEASLRAHTGILSALEAGWHDDKKDAAEKESGDGDAKEKRSDKKDGALRSFITSLHIQSDSVAEAQKEARAKVSLDVRAEAEASLKAAEQAVSEARAALARTDSQAEASLIVHAQARIEAAEHRLVGAHAAFEAEQYTEANRGAEKATFTAKETSVLVGSAPMIRFSGGAEFDFSAVTASDEHDDEEDEDSETKSREAINLGL